MESALPKNPPAGMAAQTMSQSEVEKLLALVGGGDTVSPEVNAPNGEGSGGPVLVSHHDFPQVSSLSADQMRKLRVRCEAFISSLTSRLSGHLRLECTVQMTKLETVRYQQFVNSLPGPTHLTLFKLEPMAGVCLLEIPTKLALSIVDREMGGPGQCDEEPRDLTQIETKLAAKVVTVMLGEWCGIWADTLQLRPLLLRNETSGRFLQTSASESMILSLTMEAKIAQCTEQIHLAFPQAILEPIMQKLCQDLQNVEKATAVPVAERVEWNPAFNDVPLQVTARWHALEMSARQLGELKLGDVIPLLDAGACPVELSLDSAPKFLGQLGTSGRKLAVKIIEAV